MTLKYLYGRLTRKKSAWICYGNEKKYKCAECGYATENPGLWVNDVCRVCGAKMMGIEHFYL